MPVLEVVMKEVELPPFRPRKVSKSDNFPSLLRWGGGWRVGYIVHVVRWCVCGEIQEIMDGVECTRDKRAVLLS